jgi:[1-hydroxy-2-(trimethylamino)ethyl]phosphonate dioxygenase
VSDATRSAPDIVDVTSLLALYETWGQRRYDEVVTQQEHALQCAALAAADARPPALVAACLLHDVGHLLHMAEHDSDSVPADDTMHAERGARALSAVFGPDVTEPIRLHVAAKRVLVLDPAYMTRLSAGSRASLRRQGGAATADEMDAFMQSPYAEDALTLREYDDSGKVPGLAIAPLAGYRGLLASLVRTS